MPTSRLAIAAVIAPLLLTGCGDSPEKPKSSATSVAPVPAAPAATGDSHEKVLSETIADLKKFGAVLKGVTDEASAKAAVPTVDALVTHIESLHRRDAALPALSADQRASLNNDKDVENQQAVVNLLLQFKRINADPKLRAILNDSFERFASAQ